MPSVFDYTDYRLYLKDYYAWAKLNRRGFSHRSFLADAGMAGPTYLKRVMEGLHDLTRTSIPKFAKALQLSTSESEYFDALVGFNQATTPAEKDRHFKRLMDIRPARSQTTLERTQYDYYEHWYNIAIREMLAFLPYKNNPGAFARLLTPPVPPGKVKKAIELLQTLGLLSQGPEGLRASKALLKTDPSMESLFLPRFHLSMAKLGVEALDRFNKNERYFSGTTVSISAETYDVVIEKIRALRREILEHVQADPSPKRVYHLNMQLFPLTSGPRKRGRKKKQ